MGKKNPLKSTSKKKNATTKPDSAKEMTPAGETGAVTASPTNKAKGAKKQAAAKAAPAEAQPKETKKAEVKKEKPLSIKELVLQKFDTPKPDTLFAVKADDSVRKAMMSPPFVSGLDAAETERVRQLLFKTFDLSVPDPAPIVAAVAEKASEPEINAAVPVVEKAPDPPAVPVSIPELLKLKFEVVVPTPLYMPPVTAAATPMDSPPFVSGLDAAETERVRQLLFKTFDLSVPDPAPVEPESVIPAVVEKAAEPEVKAAVPEPAVEVAAATSEVMVPEPVIEVAVAEPAVEVAEAEAVIPESPTAPEIPLSNAEQAGAQALPSEPEKSKRMFLEGVDPLVKKAIYAGFGLAAMFLLITIASFSNMSKYYLINRGDTVEVLQGRFAPLGTDRIALLTGARMLKDTKSVYTRAEVSPLIIENFISRADALMATKGMPNFEAIRPLLEDALSYAEEKAVRDSILLRLDRIDMTALVFKAAISAAKESRSELESAREYLTKAVWLAKEEGEKEMIQQKLKVVTDKLSVPPPLKEAPPSKTPPAASSPAAHH